MRVDLNAPTEERRARGAFVSAPAIGTDAGPARAGARMYRSLSTIERLLRDGAITDRQASGGELLRTDHELGIVGARNGVGSGAAASWGYAEARLGAVKRYQSALAALGPLWRYTLPICVGEPGGGDISISELARLLNRNRQEVAGIVKLGLDTLADHYEVR